LIRATGILNFAQGDLVMLGAFVGLTVVSYLQLPYLVAFILATVVTGVFGVLMERLMFGPMLRRRPPMTNLFIATLGLREILRTVAILVWGPEPQRYPALFGDEPLRIVGLFVRPQNLVVLGLAVVAMLALQYFLYRTLVGIAWRAASRDPETAALYGVSRRRNVALTFALSSALGGAGGVLVGPLFFASFGLGGAVQIKSFWAATIGGFGTVGTMLGGLALGLVETLAAGLVSSDYKNVILYGIGLAFLLLYFRPETPEGRTPGEMPRAAASGSVLSLVEDPRWRFRLKILLGILGFAAWLAFPFLAGQYANHTVDLALIFAIAVLGLQLIFGYTGMLSLGHAAFFGIGAYVSTRLMMEFGLPFWLTMPLAGVAAGLTGWAVAPVLRLSGVFLVVGTAAFNEIVYLLMINLRGLTEGAYGIYNVPDPQIGPIAIDSDFAYYFLISAVLFIVFLGLRQLTRSQFGLALRAVRENELCSVLSGVNAAGYRMKAFVIGAGCAGVAGSLYAPFTSYINPEPFAIVTSISMVTMAVVGGLGNLAGAVIGGLAIILAPEYLRFLADYRLVVYGAVLILFMMFFPGGAADLLRKPAAALISWIGRRGQAEPGDEALE
jgi:branched-chain amino acid transport system permease protein